MKERMDKNFAGNDRVVVFRFGQSHEIWKYAKDMVKIGGYLIYATCTFALEENDDEQMRFSEIGKASGITSDKMLSQALKDLDESYGLIKKNTKDGKNLYSLTDDGRSLLEVLHSLENWVDEHKREFARKKAKIK